MAHKMVCLEEIITGERFQALAEVSVIPLGSGIGESECDFVMMQQRNNNYNAFYYTETTNELPDFVQNAKTIFVNNWTLNKFFTYIFPKLKNKYIFISHNSDQCFSDQFTHFLNSDRVIKWYSQNATGEHEKLFGLPIGIANQQYLHGNLQLLKSIVEQDITKSILVYKNFDNNTNIHVRSYVDAVTNQKGISMFPKKQQQDYLLDLAQSLFCISPPGNGPDCHRIWECLYLNTIPVVKFEPCFKYFKKLPFLFVEDWNDVTVPFLREKVVQFLNQNSDIDELKISFWKKTIYA